MTEVKIIHPNPSGPTAAESPYTRKLKRLRDDVSVTHFMAPNLDKQTLATIVAALDHLIGN